VDGPAVTGITNLQYEFPNVSVEYVPVKTPIPVHFWRSVGAPHNGFSVESFMDEMAHASGKDPLEFRMQHLQDNPRDRTLEVVVQVEGALTMGLSSPSKEKLESSEGGFQSANFSAYQLPPMSKAPDVEVHILESDGPIGGMGKTGLPPVAPVVANAVFAATGTESAAAP